MSQFTAHAQNKGNIDFNGYFDTQEFNILTVNILEKLPNRFQYLPLTKALQENQQNGLGYNCDYKIQF